MTPLLSSGSRFLNPLLYEEFTKRGVDISPCIKSMLSFRLDTILILKNVEKRLSGKYFSVSIDSNTEATNVAIPFLALFFLV